MKLNALIIDDERVARENLRMMITNLSQEISLFEANDIIYAKDIIETHKIDVIFLDINMPQHSGFDLLEIIDAEKFFVVIVSAHINHSLRAIKIKVFDFLLKPFGFSTLKHTIERIQNEVEKDHNHIKSSKIAFKTRNEIYYILPTDIVYFESDNNYTTVFVANGKKILLSKSIKSIEEEMISYTFLHRVHRSYIINLNCISKYDISDGMVYLQNDSIVLPVSERKRKEFSVLIQR